MKKTDKIKMNVMIGGIPISLTVPFDDQDAVRDTEKSIDDLYNNWKARFPQKSDQTLLAMIAYQYASYYLSILDANKATAEKIISMDKEVDDALAAGKKKPAQNIDSPDIDWE